MLELGDVDRPGLVRFDPEVAARPRPTSPSRRRPHPVDNRAATATVAGALHADTRSFTTMIHQSRRWFPTRRLGRRECLVERRSPSSRSSAVLGSREHRCPARLVHGLVGDRAVLVQEHDEVVGAVDEQAGLPTYRGPSMRVPRLPTFLMNRRRSRRARARGRSRAGSPYTTDAEAVRTMKSRPARCRGRAGRSRSPLGFLTPDALAEVDPLRLDVRQGLDQLHRRAANVEDLEERAAVLPARPPARRRAPQQDREAGTSTQAASTGSPPIEARSNSAWPDRDLAAAPAGGARVAHAVSPSSSRSRAGRRSPARTSST